MPEPGAARTAAARRTAGSYKGAADLYQVPYANKAGGAATPVAGASTPDNEEYYPAFSPDDQLIAFTRVPAGQEMFANPTAEMWVVPHQTGAQATAAGRQRSAGCSGKVEPGRQQPLAQVVAGPRRPSAARPTTG